MIPVSVDIDALFMTYNSTWYIYNIYQMLFLLASSFTFLDKYVRGGMDKETATKNAESVNYQQFLLGNFVLSCLGQVVEGSFVDSLHQQESSSFRCLPC